MNRVNNLEAEVLAEAATAPVRDYSSSIEVLSSVTPATGKVDVYGEQVECLYTRLPAQTPVYINAVQIEVLTPLYAPAIETYGFVSQKVFT